MPQQQVTAYQAPQTTLTTHSSSPITIIDEKTFLANFNKASANKKQLLLEQECHIVVMLRILHQTIDDNVEQIKQLTKGSDLSIQQLKAILTIQAYMLFSTQSDTIIELREFMTSEAQKQLSEVTSQFKSAMLSDALTLAMKRTSDSQLAKLLQQQKEAFKQNEAFIRSHFLEEDIAYDNKSIVELFDVAMNFINTFFKTAQSIKIKNTDEVEFSNTNQQEIEAKFNQLGIDFEKMLQNLRVGGIKSRFKSDSGFNSKSLKQKLTAKERGQKAPVPDNAEDDYVENIERLQAKYLDNYDVYFEQYNELIAKSKQDFSWLKLEVLDGFFELVYKNGRDLKRYTRMMLDEMVLQLARKPNYADQSLVLIELIWLPLYNQLCLKGDTEFNIQPTGSNIGKEELFEQLQNLPSLHEMLAEAKLALMSRQAIGYSASSTAAAKPIPLSLEASKTEAALIRSPENNTALTVLSLKDIENDPQARAKAGVPKDIPGQVKQANLEFIKKYLGQGCKPSPTDTPDSNRATAIGLFNQEVSKLPSLEDAKALFETSKPYINQFNLGCCVLPTMFWNWLVGKKHTTSWRNAMKQVRAQSLTLLEAEVTKLATPEEKIALLQQWRKENLFKQHRNESFFQGAYGRTRAIYEYIDPEIKRQQAIIAARSVQQIRNQYS